MNIIQRAQELRNSLFGSTEKQNPSFEGLKPLASALESIKRGGVNRITVKNTSATLYRDGIYLITVTLSTSSPASGFVYFASEGNDVAGIETSWDYVYYRTDGAFAPGGRNPASGRSAASGRGGV